MVVSVYMFSNEKSIRVGYIYVWRNIGFPVVLSFS